MNLRLDHDRFGIEFPLNLADGIIDSARIANDCTRRDGNTEILEDFFCLVLVDFQTTPPVRAVILNAGKCGITSGEIKSTPATGTARNMRHSAV